MKITAGIKNIPVISNILGRTEKFSNFLFIYRRTNAAVQSWCTHASGQFWLRTRQMQAALLHLVVYVNYVCCTKSMSDAFDDIFVCVQKAVRMS